MVFRLHYYQSNDLNSFKYAGNSSELDDSEEHQFRGYED